MSPVKLGIGTVQFGMAYGVSGPGEKTPAEEVAKILAAAEEIGIRILDTAPAYGESERVLGETLSSHHPFRIVTKTPLFKKERIEALEAQNLAESFARSLENLRQNSVYALLTHHANDLTVPGGDLLIETMKGLKQRGLVKKIGVSVYNGQEIDRFLPFFTPDIIQLPLNPFDQRLLQSGHLAKLKRLKIEVHARSIFLQGLLLMEPGTLPPYFERVQREIRAYQRFLQERKLTPLQASVSFAMNVREIDSFVCGVCSLQQLQEIIVAVRSGSVEEDFSRFSLEDESILNPSLWQLG